MDGRERVSNTVRIEFEVEDMDRDLSWVVWSRRKGPGTVRVESEERRDVTAAPMKWSTRVEEAGEELARDEREPAMRAVSS
jgi:hypothetical protein